MLVIGRSYELSIQVEVAITGVGEMTKLAEEMMEYEDEDETSEDAMTGSETKAAGATGTKLTEEMTEKPEAAGEAKTAAEAAGTGVT